MNKIRMRVWVGPTQVKAIAERFREAGLVDVTEGVERVYFHMWAHDLDEARDVIMQCLRTVHGKTFGLRGSDFFWG